MITKLMDGILWLLELFNLLRFHPDSFIQAGGPGATPLVSVPLLSGIRWLLKLFAKALFRLVYSLGYPAPRVKWKVWYRRH